MTNRVDFESPQFVYIESSDEGHRNELEVIVNLTCTAPSCPPSFDPVHGGDPGWGPEFDVVDVSFGMPMGKDGYAYHTVSWRFFEGLVGFAIAEVVFDAAVTDACENGDF